MQAHAVRLGNAWVTPTSLCVSLTEAGEETKPEKNGNMILYLCFSSAHLPP